MKHILNGEEERQREEKNMAKKSGCLVAVVAVLAIGAIGSVMGGGSDDKPKKVETAVSTEAKKTTQRKKKRNKKYFQSVIRLNLKTLQSHLCPQQNQPELTSSSRMTEKSF